MITAKELNDLASTTKKFEEAIIEASQDKTVMARGYIDWNLRITDIFRLQLEKAGYTISSRGSGPNETVQIISWIMIPTKK